VSPVTIKKPSKEEGPCSPHFEKMGKDNRGKKHPSTRRNMPGLGRLPWAWGRKVVPGKTWDCFDTGMKNVGGPSGACRRKDRGKRRRLQHGKKNGQRRGSQLKKNSMHGGAKNFWKVPKKGTYGGGAGRAAINREKTSPYILGNSGSHWRGTLCFSPEGGWGKPGRLKKNARKESKQLGQRLSMKGPT